jgi:hypothetical protein
MKNRSHSLSILFAFVAFLVAGLPVNAAETAFASAPTVQGSATLPPDNSPFTPNSPEKEKRVKKLIKKITATYGFSFGPEELLPSWGARMDKLYSLHKELSDNDWRLLAEMYVTFHNSDLKFIVGIPFDHYSKNTLHFDNAMKILLAMYGKASLETLSAMTAAIHWPPTLREGEVNTIKEIIEFKPWSYLSEYKEDQKQNNK